MAVLTVEQILSGSTLGLSSGLSDLLFLEIGGRTVLYGLSRTENRLVEIEVASDGALTFEDALNLQGTFPAGSEPLLGHAATAGGNTQLVLAGLPASDGQTVSLSGTGSLGSQHSIPVGQLVAPVSFHLSGTPGMLSGKFGGGVNLYTDTGGGYAWSAGLNDTADRYLADVSASVSFVQNGTVFAATTSAVEGGVNFVSLAKNTISQIGKLGAAEGLPIDMPSDIDVVQRLGETLLVLSAQGTNSVSVLRVVDGLPYLADHILDFENTRFAQASTLDTITYDDFAFVAVGGAEGGVTLMTVLPGGRLVHLNSLADDEATTLYRMSSVELAISGSVLQIFGASFWEAGVTRISFDLSEFGDVILADGSGGTVTGTGADDQLIGSDVSDTLSGGDGNDILLDGAGIDMMSGGNGADLFVFAADGLSDTISDFERGVDRLDLSAFDFLYDVSQLGIAPTADGAILTHGAEVITVFTADGLPLTAADLSNDDILNVDRPPFLALGQNLVGDTANDTLNGGTGPDTIAGAAGNDSLSGKFGDDSLLGGAGLDVLLGDGGNDTLRGQSEEDTLAGGSGDDLLFGDGGDDVIYGDDWSGG